MLVTGVRAAAVAVLFCVSWAQVGSQDPWKGIKPPTYTEDDAPAFLAKVNKKLQKLASSAVKKEWNYKVTLTDEAAKKLGEAKENYDVFLASVWPEASQFPWQSFQDELLKRQFFYLSQLDAAALAPEDRAKLVSEIAAMVNIYGSAKVKIFNSTNAEATLNFDDVSEKFSEDYLNTCEMSYYWQGWHNTVGRAEKPHFVEYVKLVNQEAKLNNFTDYSALWQAKYEIENVEKVVADLADQIEPLVKQVHAFVRRRLWEVHGSSIIDLKGPIPVSLLGDIWGMNALSIFNITTPFPKKPTIDVTAQLKAQNYTGKKMAEKAEEFFLSLGLENMTKEFWKNSIFERPAGGKNIDCDEESFDYYNGRDYRIKYCTTPTLNDFGGIHHEMGMIESFMSWAKLPFLLQRSPNEGFSDSIGELVNLYVTSPTHLKTIGLLDANWELDKEQELNYLMQQALYIVLFIPYSYSLDLWRWRVFQGKITPENYNCEYWKIRSELQGVVPPVNRGQLDFDPGAKHHVDNDEQYIKYFFNVIVQYQLHRSLCIEAKEYDPKDNNSKPLYLCDITGNKDVGAKLKSMLSLGGSKSWQDALEIVTGQRNIDATALLEFFQPLTECLGKQNKKKGEKIGWSSGKIKFCEKDVKIPAGPCNYT